MFDLRQLQALSAVAAEGSVSRAAQRLGWSQPTVDYHLRNLDALVGTELTTRHNRGCTLTAAGMFLLERGEEILSLSQRALTDVRDLAQLGRVRLKFGTFPTAAAHLLPGISRRLSDIGIDLDASLEELAPLVTRINQRTLDAALVYCAHGYNLPFRADVHTTQLLTDPMMVALPSAHPAAAHSSFTADTLCTLADQPWVVGATPGDTLDDLLHHTFAAHQLTLRIAIRTDDYAVVLGMVAAGLAVALVPGLIGNRPPEGVTLKPIRDPRFARDILLAAPAGSAGPSSAVRQLAESVRKTIAAQRLTAHAES